MYCCTMQKHKKADLAFLQANRVHACEPSEPTAWHVIEFPVAPNCPPCPWSPAFFPLWHLDIHEYRHTSECGPKLKLRWMANLCMKTLGVCEYEIERACCYVCVFPAEWNVRLQPSRALKGRRLWPLHTHEHILLCDYLSPYMLSCCTRKKKQYISLQGCTD